MPILGNIHTFESLKIRDYRLLWLSHLTTSTGQWMDQTARSWLIYDITGSPLQLGLVSAARGLPMLFFGVLAGVAADRYGRKPQIIFAQAANSFFNLILATLIVTGHVQPWHIYTTAFLSGTVQAFQDPARQVLISDLAGEKNLLNAVALSSAAFNASRGIGPAICGLLIYLVGVGFSYYTLAIMYGLATLWTIQIRVSGRPAAFNIPGKAQSISIFSSMKEGFAYLASSRLMLGLMVLALAPVILGMPFISLMPLFAIDVFHGDSITQGLLLAMVGLGAMIGALTIASLESQQGNGKILIIGGCSFGLSLVFFSQSPTLALAMVFTLLNGVSNGFFFSQNQTLLQMSAPYELRGRIIGISYLSRGLMPVGSLLAGSLAALLGGPWAVTIMGISCFLVVVGITLFVPEILKVRTGSD